MHQDGRDTQDRQTKRGDGMDKGSGGEMERYTLGDTRMATRLKGGSTGCKKMVLTYYLIIKMESGLK